MKMSMVVASVVRSNDQGLLVEKSEKYLVKHDDLEEPGMKVITYLTPFAKEKPVVIKQITLVDEKNDLLDSDGESIYQAGIAIITINEKNGIEKKQRCNFYVCADCFSDCHNKLVDFCESFISGGYQILSIKVTSIIEILGTETN